MKRTLSSLMLTLVASSVVALSACGNRAVLTETHANSTRTIFQRQAANPAAGTRPAKIVDLDSQDAETIAKTYRKTMAGQGGGSTSGTNLLMLGAPAAAAAGPAYMPAPSVPTTN